MLTLRDCRPGVEVMCIDSASYLRTGNSRNLEKIQKFSVYTIEGLAPWMFGNRGRSIFLVGVDGRYPNGSRFRYGLFRFRLLDPQALDVFRTTTSEKSRELV